MSFITELFNTNPDKIKSGGGLDVSPGYQELSFDELDCPQYYGPEESERVPEEPKGKNKKSHKKKKNQQPNKDEKPSNDNNVKKDQYSSGVANKQTGKDIKGNNSQYSTGYYYGPDYDKKPPKLTFYKQLREIKMTILLLENSVDVSKVNDTVLQINKKFMTSDIAAVIRFGDKVETKKRNTTKFTDEDMQCSPEANTDVAFYDALVEVACIINKYHMKTSETETAKEKISSVDVIGIGTCRDTCSILPKDFCIREFNNAIKKENITTRFYCLTEDSFLDAAEVGFRSIGSISKDY